MSRITRSRDDKYNTKINKYKDDINKTDDLTVLEKINDNIENDKTLKTNDNDKRALLKLIEEKMDLLGNDDEKYQKSSGKIIEDNFQKLNSYFGLNKNPLNGINKISAKGINNYIKLNFSKKKYYFDLFDNLYNHVISIYGENVNTIIYMLLMLDSVHDFIGERTDLETGDKSLMIQTIFQIRDIDSNLFKRLNKLKAGDFENDLLLWLLYIKYNDNSQLVKNTLFGDVISIAEQTNKDNMSSLFTIDAFDKSFDAYRTTLFYLNRSSIETSELSAEIEKYKDIYIFRIQVIELYNNLLKILKNKDKTKTKKLEKRKWQQAIHAIRNYIISFNFETLKNNLVKSSNTRNDLQNNMQLFFNNFIDNYQGKNSNVYYYDITTIRNNLRDIITHLNNIDKSSQEIILVNELLNKVNSMNQYGTPNIQNFYDKPIDKFNNTTEDDEVNITDALKQTEKNIINRIINDSRNYIEFVAIPPQLFDANESTGGENMTILGIRNQITMIRQQNPVFTFDLLRDKCTITYDLSNNCKFTITNDNYPIKEIAIKQDFIISGYGSPWVQLLNKYAYNSRTKTLVCGSCPGVTDLYELYKIFKNQGQYALDNIFQIKRAGDYSQILFCQQFNSDINNTKKILFLSNDRMSSSFCLMMGVPFVAPVYSGVMGSKTFSVYYNPYSDKSMLYEQNLEEFSDYDIKKLLIKLRSLQNDCIQIRDTVCDDLSETISKVESISKDTDDYDKYKILLTSQEIYDKNKYKINRRRELAIAVSNLLSIRNPQVITIDSPASFFNNDQKIIYNQVYKSIEKIYNYIISLSFENDIENLELQNYSNLYNAIANNIKHFLSLTPSSSSSSSSSSSYQPFRSISEAGRGLLGLGFNNFDSNTDTIVKYVYHNFDKDISLKKYKDYETIMFYNEKGYLLVQDFNPDAVIKIKSLTKPKEHTYPDGTKITFKLN